MVKLGDIVEIISGFPFKSALFLDDAKQIPLVKGENLQPGYIDWSKSRYWSAEEYDQLQKYHLVENDIVVAMDRPWVPAGLKWAYIKKGDPKSLLVQRVARLRTTDANMLDQIYLRYLISSESFSKYIEPIVTGTNVPHISAKQIGDFKFQLPNIENQRLIGNFLSDYDDLIFNNGKRIKKLENIIDILYQEWFINFKFPNHEQVEFVDGIPEGWSIQTISDVCETVGGGTPSTKIDAYWENGDVEWVTPTDITKLKSLILINPEKKITRLGLEKSSAKLVPPNTILMTSRASIGYFGLIDREVCTNQGFISIIPHNEIMRYYLLLNLKSRVSEIDSLASGATFKEISKSSFRKMPIVLPADEILEKFDQLIRPIISQMRNLEQQNDQLFKLKETLLPRLMSGELDVSKLSSIE